MNQLTKRIILSFFVLLSIILPSVILSQSNTNPAKIQDSTTTTPGKIWGYVFGDYYYKAHSDSAGRGGTNQYTGIPQSRNAFQIRRVYLGYNYAINPSFSAELLLAAEDNITNTTGTTTGDLLSDNKLSFYLKLVNLRWKNIWKGTDLVIGQAPTPAFSLLTEQIWGYRSIEKTITDIRKTPSYDFGAMLQGKFDPADGKFGYNLMIGNGTGAKPENDNFKWFYGEVFAKFFDKKLILDAYADYERLNWIPGFHHSRNMLKGFIAYQTPAFTFGTESFINHGQNDVAGIKASQKDTLSADATGISVYVKGQITPKKLGYFARFDSYNPDTHYTQNYTSYLGFSANYEPNNKEKFVTAGLDYTPAKNIHFMPNIWYNGYQAQQSNFSGAANRDHDLVFRITFFYIYDK